MLNSRRTSRTTCSAYDNTPKTPEWASEICGASPEAIRNLARAMGKDHKVGFLVSAASARVNNTDNLPQLVMTVGAWAATWASRAT